MPSVIDLTTLARKLREAPETLVDQEDRKDREDISPYMFEVILPMLAREEYPLLRDIDFDQFEQRDPARLAGYMQDRGRRRSELTWLNRGLCGLEPAWVTVRAFL